jgi:peptide/nickel transport system substrate-binding protein
MFSHSNLTRFGTFALVLLAACGGGGDDATVDADMGAPVQGGTAIIGIKSDFAGLNPVTNSALATDDVIKYMLFTPLIQYDENLQPQPYLAESWELSDTSVTFKLRSDVKWHDGEPVTAEDVKFTFELAKNPETASLLGSAYLNMVESATVVDPNTIRFAFIEPHAQPLDAFWWAPLPKHQLGNVPAAELSQAQFNNQPVGSGPFKFVSWDKGQNLTLEANPQFPAGLGGRPKLDRVVFRIIPEATTRQTEFLTGQIDVNYNVLPEGAQQIEKQRGVDLAHYPAREFTYLGWNNERAPFNDPRVRQALAMTVDRQKIVDALMFGMAKPAGSVIPTFSPFAPNLEPLPYDPAQAKQLFAQAGWRDTNKDGILDKNGQPLRINLTTNSANGLFIDVATVLQQQMKQAGVDLQLQPVEFQTMLKQHKSRDYEAILTNWTWDYFKVDPTPLFSCEEAQKAGSANRAGYCNPQVDQIMESGLTTTDPERAKAVWATFAQALQKDQPITPLFWLEEIAGEGQRLQNVEMDARSKLVNVKEWWIPQGMRRG